MAVLQVCCPGGALVSLTVPCCRSWLLQSSSSLSVWRLACWVPARATAAAEPPPSGLMIWTTWEAVLAMLSAVQSTVTVIPG